MISISPENPNIQSQRTLIESLQSELDDASYVAGSLILMQHSQQGVQLFNENLFAEKQLLTALADYEKAK